MGDAPAEVDGGEPEAGFETWFFAGPIFEIFVRSLPVLPVGAARFDGAGFGAKVVNIERF